MNNESASNDARIYTVSLYTPSNPFGAIVKIDGFQPFADVSIPGGTSINKVLTIEKGPGPTYNYDSLMMIIYAPCQYEAGTSDNFDIVDTVYVSAHFLPTCTDVNFATPDDQWVLNNSFQDTMGIGILDYNINFFDFNSIRLDYKPSAQANWIGLQTFHKDTSGMNDPTAIQIPTSTSFTLWDWLTDQVVDGDYDLRLTTQCTLADVTSPTHTGVMDRINPHPFGTPSPADGILDPAEDIKIRFNEPVDLGSLTSLNFDVRGVLNGTETNHASNLYFDGVNDFVEVVAGIPVQSRDFTLEFSVKRAGTGQEAILSQGSDANEQIYVGFNSADQLEFIINNQTVTSTVAYADNDWHYFAVAYSFDNETAEMFEASGSTTASLINNGNVNIYPKYNGADKFNIGKSVANNSHFNGNIDDVRVWNTTRSLSEFAQLKSKMLSSNEPGLLYNWRFDEADGMFVEDHVRARDGQIFGAEWTIEPSGNAISFDGADDYLRINKGDVNITKGMDFTLEFWFNSTQTAAATLVSNGTGTGLASDSLYSWNIAKDAAGKIHVHHNGNDFVAVDSNYFDGQWHHFALVLNRVGNITAYVDGNLQNSVQALAFGELGGSAMYLGARGYYTGTVENFDSHFNGKMDEFRFWDASRKYEQITRDKQNRMKGDEFALRLYMPFENYALDATGIPILSASTAEQIDSTNHIVLNPNGASIINTTPKIKLPRPIQSVAFTYSVNGDEIIITPTTSSEIIENVTLDITVKGVKDLHGNFMESPKTWIAYVDKNQVVWQDDILSFNKPFGDPLSFSTAVVNNGGATKTFTIENIPSWLTVSPISGTITPNSVTPVNVVVDPLMNIGDYVQDIQLLTDFGFPEQLTIDIKVREQEPNWTVNPADYINSMSIIGYLEINNVVSASAEDMLSVFVDGNCRGVAHLEYVPLLDRYLVFLDVYSNLNNGENLEFRIWDASTGTIFTDIIPGNLSFVSNDLIGTVNAPQLFKTNYEISVDIPLNAGWNWVSNFLFNPDSMNIDKTLESLESVNSDEIKGQAEFSNYLSSNGWVGTLNNVGIVPEAGYKLKVANTDTLVLKGDILDPTSRTINLVQGWNWIGFISLRNQNITGALGNLNPTDGDIIKAKSQFAVYNTLLGWVGSLQTMIPGQAYMYKSATNTSFVYPAVGQYKFGNVNKENLYLNKQWVVNHEQFAGNMTSIAQLDTDCDYVLDNNNLTLGVFDSEANCRGTNIIEWLNDDKLSFLTIAGDVSEKLNYSILDNNTGRVFDLEEQVEFSANKHIGDVNSPISLKITDEVCFKMQFVKPDEANDDSEIAALGNNELFQVYPTVFEDEVGLYYLAKNAEKEAEVVLYNIWGQIMYSKNINQYDGFNKVSINFDEVELSKGIYHFVLYSGNEMQSVKLIKE
ncbi:MAG: LamG-like jellyroll fold domain-containing protein [Chitinophagales bacterium]